MDMNRILSVLALVLTGSGNVVVNADDGFRRESSRLQQQHNSAKHDSDVMTTSSQCDRLSDVHNLVVKIMQEHLSLRDDVTRLQRIVQSDSRERAEVQLRHSADVDSSDVMKRLKAVERQVRRLHKSLTRGSDVKNGGYANLTRDVTTLQQVLDHFSEKQTDINGRIAKRVRDVEHVIRSDDVSNSKGRHILFYFSR